MSPILVGVLGLVVGSFLNVVIFRMKHGRSFVKGRSMCASCQHALGALDLIPVVSFIFLRGRCRYCKARISFQYPLVEIATAMVFLIIYYKYQDLIGLWNIKRAFGLSAKTHQPLYLLPFRDGIFSALLLVIFIYDLRYYLILDKLVLPLIVFAFAINVALGFSPERMLVSAVAVAGFFALQFLLSKGKWVGGGDIRLGFLIGVMLSLPGSLDALFSAYIIGALVSVALL